MTRNYRWPGAFIPVELDDYGLDPIAFRLYAYFAQLRDFDSLEDVARHCRVRLVDVLGAEQALLAAGLIKREPPFTYVLTPVDEWVPKQVFHTQKEG
jgi:hypothetical protein